MTVFLANCFFNAAGWWGLKVESPGRLGPGCLRVEHLPWAQAVMPRSGMESRIGLPAGGLLLPLPASLPLSVSLMSK